MQRPRRRGRLKAPNKPISLANSVSSSPHPHEVTRVLNTMTGISASADIIRVYVQEGKSCLPTTTLDRAFVLWDEILLLPLSTIPPLQKSLAIYELILIDIQKNLSSNDPLDDTIDRRLDDVMIQFQEALDLLKGTIDQRSSPNSTHFFQNSHHIIISGGNFSSNMMVHDPVVQERSHKILQIIYIQCGVLFY